MTPTTCPRCGYRGVARRKAKGTLFWTFVTLHVVVLIGIVGVISGWWKLVDPATGPAGQPATLEQPPAATPTAPPAEERTYSAEEERAYQAMEEFVLDRLTHPITAEFGVLEGVPRITPMPDQKYRIRAYVDAENDFHDTVRKPFLGVVQEVGLDEWELLGLRFTGLELLGWQSLIDQLTPDLPAATTLPVPE